MRTTRRFVAGPLVALLLLLGACPAKGDRTLLGEMVLQFDLLAGGGYTVTKDDAQYVYRAQITDDGDRCELWIEANHLSHLRVKLNTYQDELGSLLAGGPQTIDATDNRARSIVVNAATIYIDSETDDGAGLPLASWYSIGGRVQLDAVPAPRARMRMTFDSVQLRGFGDRTLDATLTGYVEATYVGASVISADGARACPQFEEIPPDIFGR